jgi:hypothetical protein
MTDRDKNNETLDFQSDSGIVRKVYRIPLTTEDEISVTIGNRTYPVNNIVDRGVQIACEAAADLEEGSDLGRVGLLMQGQSMDVRAQVVYVTEVEPQSFVCGLALEFLQPGDEKQVRGFVESKRRELFDSGSS